MSVAFKCKMCGGTLSINDGETIAICEYCGTKQTLPKFDSEKKTSLLDRADHFRRNNEYDKAMSIYEQILADEKTDAEIYWLIVLCRFGIEYVEDPSTHNRIPTVNRVQYNSILNDEDYLKAIDLADSYQKDIYVEEANRINEIQKNILEISNKEDPFDVFICYKETDENGRRTEDSVIAQDIYKELSNEGYKVFFARITLEDIIGTAYEPYIFAALNSAKVMLVVGSKKENFNAVWVKNEWTRFLSLINQGQKKVLVPCYKNMDPYDLPEEFAYLQAQDINKLGYMQDLSRGIEKIVGVKKISAIKINGAEDNIQALFKRAEMFISEGDKSSAYKQYDKVLDIDPENGQAYLLKFLFDLNVKDIDGLKNLRKPFADNDNYLKAIKYCDISIVELLTNYNSLAEKKFAEDQERERIDKEKYDEQIRLQKEENKKELIKKLKIAGVVLGILLLIGICIYTYLGVIIPGQKYKVATEVYESGDYESAKQLFNEVRNYKDSRGMALDCEYNLLVNDYSDDYVAKLVDVSLNSDNSSKSKEVKYKAALKLKDLSYYHDALFAFQKLGNYSDSKDQYAEVLIAISENEFINGEYDKALYNMNELANVKNSEGINVLNRMIDELYDEVIANCKEFNFDGAKKVYSYFSDYRQIDIDSIISEYESKKDILFKGILGSWVSYDTKYNYNSALYMMFFDDYDNYTGSCFTPSENYITFRYSFDFDSNCFILETHDGASWLAKVDDDSMTLSWLDGYDSNTIGLAGKDYGDAHYKKVFIGDERNLNKKQIFVNSTITIPAKINDYYYGSNYVVGGSILDVQDIQVDGKTKYYKVNTLADKAGWIASDYATELHKVKVIYEYINVRSGPGTEYDILEKALENSEFDIYDVENTNSGLWLKIKFNNTYGYLGDISSLEYVDSWDEQ